MGTMGLTKGRTMKERNKELEKMMEHCAENAGKMDSDGDYDNSPKKGKDDKNDKMDND